MTVLVCSDLDRTLIYSAAAFALDGPDETMPRLLCVEFYRGAPLSYLTETAARTLEALSAAAVFVPATTRTPEQYRRVRLLEKPPAYAITANGGHLLVDGADDPEWAASVRERVAGRSAPLAEIEERLARDGGDFVLKRRSASGPPVQHLRTGVLGQACSTRSIPGDALDLLHGHPSGGVQAVISASTASPRSSAGMLSAHSGSVPPAVGEAGSRR